jgi:enoyl-[acyl-carrier protein] reductase III
MGPIAGEADLFSLRGRTILVAGGTRGIGRAISLRFARAGAHVIANFLRNESSANQLTAEAAQENLHISLCRADLTTDKGLEVVNQTVTEARPQLSGLVFCAATGVHRPIDDLTDRHFDFIFNLNTRAFFKLVKLIKPHLSNGSNILAVSSWGASRALPDYSLIGSSKGALESLARHLAAELAAAGVRVNILTAGAVMTDAWKSIPNSQSRIDKTVERTPLGRLVTAEEVAHAAQFLCSDAASGIIGHTLIIDGGSGILA